MVSLSRQTRSEQRSNIELYDVVCECAMHGLDVAGARRCRSVGRCRLRGHGHGRRGDRVGEEFDVRRSESVPAIATMKYFLTSEAGRSFMRIRLIIAPVALAAAFLAGCSANTPPATPTTASAAPTDNGVSALPAQEILAKA